jgi:hypothetical protein
VTWWAWTALWVGLVLGALGVFFLVGRSLWRKGMALAGELGAATERLSAVATELGELQQRPDGEDLAVFADPLELRQQRILARRRPARAGRRGRATGRKK